ncbi:hypothetical protein HanXRQr2_Chr11g0513751 [Helianthus annuus]|uniref:Uncharacterized protein n=1 Tax=Helianthus annuus TaxID=4232 RepID=A0A251TD81_HELAN|nr:hypothetical protein HanXRQr2_Chr11g0513751 [Helianthus annuus]KAJ0503180.1 hypothetical protein HanHA300_Chr11g0421411 [Helianthus annuus]KAJ0511438.1 hypothetical protein HanIR_Chr11g0552171 [Helianthus annuus]KAJ0519147.1 hypothetical protein HanHA89_Chr11g0445551 [Helianthus annuus]KAJ0687141.1 hypothetical protein HanLR1_Chr11g0422801 [Helianthus annuus]
MMMTTTTMSGMLWLGAFMMADGVELLWIRALVMLVVVLDLYEDGYGFTRETHLHDEDDDTLIREF